MCMAIAQQTMHWTTNDNVAGMLKLLELAANKGARLCVFPELALTGFHRGIRSEANPTIVEPALEKIQTACRLLQIACAFGAPQFAAEGGIFNSYLLVNAQGNFTLNYAKNGLTPSEETFFAAGSKRPTADFDGLTCATVMCREMDDFDAVTRSFISHRVDLVLWPSLVGHPPGTIHETDEDTNDLGYVKRAGAIAKRLQSYVVQSNWPNALNNPESTYMGESKVYAPTGDILITLPRDQAGVGVFTLGHTTLDWTASPN